MPNTATVTAKSGPNIAATAQVFNDLSSVAFNVGAQTLVIVQTGNRVTHFDLFGVATVTYTISSHSATITVS